MRKRGEYACFTFEEDRCEASCASYAHKCAKGGRGFKRTGRLFMKEGKGSGRKEMSGMRRGLYYCAPKGRAGARAVLFKTLFGAR